MTREELEHAIRAAADITRQKTLIVIGSQAVLGQYPDAPAELLISMEVDIYAPKAPEMSDMIDGALGDLSPFQYQFGFSVDGVAPTTARLPSGWQQRLIPVCNPNTNGATGWCIEVHDIAVSKYFAGREKDLRYLKVLWKERLIDLDTFEKRLDTTDIDSATRQRIKSQARAHAAGREPGSAPKPTLADALAKFEPTRTAPTTAPQQRAPAKDHERD